MKTAREFEELLLEHARLNVVHWLTDPNWSDVVYELARNPLSSVEVVEHIKHEEGNYYTNLSVVFKYTDEDGNVQHFQAIGDEQSYRYESSWDRDLTEVTSREKIVTEWTPLQPRDF